MELKKILVPTDFSKEATNALEVAIEIARKAKAGVDLLHVLDVPGAGHYDSLDIMGMSKSSADPAMYKAYMMQLMTVTKQRFQAIKDQYSDVAVQEHVVFDTLAKHLSEFVAKQNTDLIVIGSKGAGGVDEILVGSNTEKVIRSVKAPVLTVKREEKGFAPENIVFASNFINVSSRAADVLKSTQKLFGSKIHFVKIITPNSFEPTSDTQVSIKKFAEVHGFENYTVNAYNYYTEEEGIRVFSESIRAGLVSLTTHGRTGIAHLLLGSIAEDVANHSKLPVLTFNQHYK